MIQTGSDRRAVACRQSAKGSVETVADSLAVAVKTERYQQQPV